MSELQDLERNRPAELFQLATITPDGLKLETRIKVPDGYWHLRRIDRVELSCVCVGYKPLYSFQPWDHSRAMDRESRALREMLANERRLRVR